MTLKINLTSVRDFKKRKKIIVEHTQIIIRMLIVE